MPDSKKTTAPTVVAQIWDYEPTEGPQTLYRHFVDKALSDHLPQLENLDDATRELVYAAVDLTFQVVCTAAHVAPTWHGLYAFINAQLFIPPAAPWTKPEAQQ